ncbi:MAG: hypothetical protein KF802_02340 [Bdellovibrionaceae bacterium]|nr:hypothetical protein [Pseudobdellovibrionaceae bacterium]
MKLKKFKIYLRAIKAYCKAVNIKLIPVRGFEGCGEYDPNRRVIKYDNTLSNSDIISTLLHELGHYLDDLRNPNKYAGAHHYYGRTRLERNYVYLTVNQKQVLFSTETEAWDNAEAIAKQLKIPLGNWFKKDKISSLNTYRSIRVY